MKGEEDVREKAVLGERRGWGDARRRGENVVVSQFAREEVYLVR
jgi:hypothetical protein